MPLKLEYEPGFQRPSKRRRLSYETDMARREVLEEGDPRYVSYREDTQNQAGCEEPTGKDTSALASNMGLVTSDRDELIQCIKRGQRPTWVPTPGLRALRAQEDALHGNEDILDHDSPISPTTTSFHIDDDLLFGPWVSGRNNKVPERSQLEVPAEEYEDPMAMHSPGSSFENQNSEPFSDDNKFPLRMSPPSWLDGPTKSTIGRAVSGNRPPPIMTSLRLNRPRAPSLSSNFVMRVPTSPLVNAVNNPNLDFSPKVEPAEIQEGNLQGRRKTLGPSSFQSYVASSMSIDASTPNFSRPLLPPPLRRGSSMPYQTHQPRKSLGSFTLQPGFTLQTPPSPGRRPSLAESSPKRRTSMIGSFEESILRGCMSTPASKPFDFVAQIGVMGKGDCAASLKCPAQVSVPFQAVFYSYPSSQGFRSIADDTPSPYVGTVDLEHNLKPVALATKRRRAATISAGMEGEVEGLLSDSDPRAPENTSIGKALARDAEMHVQQKSPKSASKVKLGGAYRVPQQGQLQIVIKNSNNIGVKLFLIPYDLTGMESGTKTFIRQKSYSSGSITEGALSDKSSQPSNSDPLKDKSILRYLIHVRFCSPSKGKFYLFDNIRVVFANRVPDGKEKLKNEVQIPEPKYSPWKAATTTQRSASTASIDFSSAATSPTYSPPGRFGDELHVAKAYNTDIIPEEASSVADSTIPFHIPNMGRRGTLATLDLPEQNKTPFVFADIAEKEDIPVQQPERALSPVQGFFASTSSRSSPIPWGSSNSSTTRSFSPAPVEAGNGLLSRQFRGLHGSSIDESTEIVLGSRAPARVSSEVSPRASADRRKHDGNADE